MLSIKKTIISITHDLSFAALSDELIVLKEGQIILRGKPQDVFLEEEKLKSSNLELPLGVKVYNELKKIRDKEQRLIGGAMGIQFNAVGYKYKGFTKAYDAINDINLSICEQNEFIAIIGQTGSGKSTLVQHMNALLQPTSGQVMIFDHVLPAKRKQKINHIRQKVGLLFQFPEYQLFEETVLKDIMFGPKNFKVSDAIAKEQALKASNLVGLDETLLSKSPFRISGGQMRKVAVAGVLAMNPKILVLDEPTRGLDPKS